MKNIIVIAALATVALTLTGCLGSAPITAPKSPIYASWKAPLATDMNNAVLGDRVGKSSATCYAFGLWTQGDMSLEAAMRDGNISKVTHVDYKYENHFLFAIQKFTIIAYGTGPKKK